MVGFIDAHRDAHGVKPIWKVLPIAPSVTRQANWEKNSAERAPTTIIWPCAMTRGPNPMLLGELLRAKRGVKSCAASSDTSSEKSTARCACLGPSLPELDGRRSFNALAETINGLPKAEVIHRRGPWRSFDADEFATLEGVDWSTTAGRCQQIVLARGPEASSSLSASR